uniref:Uncharacterized protein n=1 Tax=Setaria italica TaxID=4555 RepID=K3ZZF3_SETIT
MLGIFTNISRARNEEQVSFRVVQWEADKTHSLDELEAQHQYANNLEKQIEALAQKLQSANALQAEAFQVTEERDKVAEITTEFNKLTQKVSKSVELEKKVHDLEQKLPRNSKQNDKSLGADAASPNPIQQEVLPCSTIIPVFFSPLSQQSTIASFFIFLPP